MVSIPTTHLSRARCVNHFLERALLIDLAMSRSTKTLCLHYYKKYLFLKIRNK